MGVAVERDDGPQRNLYGAPTRYSLVRSEILRAANRARLERGQLRIPNGPPSLTAGLLDFPFVGEARVA